MCKIEDGSTRAYGAALMSAYGELEYALSDKPEKCPFEPSRTVMQQYEDHVYQPLYYVAESFQEILTTVR